MFDKLGYRIPATFLKAAATDRSRVPLVVQDKKDKKGKKKEKSDTQSRVSGTRSALDKEQSVISDNQADETPVNNKPSRKVSVSHHKEP